MTEFEHKPYDKIYVRDMIKLSLDDLIGMMSSLEAANAYWVDGVLFASFAMTESEELAKKEMNNEMFLDKVIFAVYENYSKTVKSTIQETVNAGKKLKTSKKENLEILEKLAKLKDAGIITAKEFQDKKKKILSNI